MGEDIVGGYFLVEEPVVFKVEGEGGLDLGPEVLHGSAEAWVGGLADDGVGEVMVNDFETSLFIILIAAKGVEVDEGVFDFEILEEVLSE